MHAPVAGRASDRRELWKSCSTQYGKPARESFFLIAHERKVIGLVMKCGELNKSRLKKVRISLTRKAGYLERAELHVPVLVAVRSGILVMVLPWGRQATCHFQ